MAKEYAYIHYNDTLQTAEQTADGRLVQLNTMKIAGTTDLVSVDEMNCLMGLFPGRVTGKVVSQDNMANVATYVYEELKKEIAGLELDERARAWFDAKIVSLDSIMGDIKLDPELCGGIDDIFNKVVGLQEMVRNAQNVSRNKTK